MSIPGTSPAKPLAVPRRPFDASHVHTWELRDVEYDTWGQVSFYECLACPAVRYV
jgi:hypothetical protein